MLGEVESKLLAEAQLQQIVVERFFADLHLQRCVLQRPALQLLLASLLVLDKHSVIELAPGADFLDDFLNGPLLCALVLGVLARWLDLLLLVLRGLRA